jgi:HAD superfamily hydrolase (TIGR01458 family)
MTPDAATGRNLRRELAAVRALLLDLDGVLVLKGVPILGAAESLATLESRGIPFLVGTNTSLFSRATLSRELRAAGIDVAPERIVSAASAAAGYCRRHFPNEPVYVMGSPDGLVEFEGLRLLSNSEAADAGTAAAVVVGDAADEFTPGNMQSAFTLLKNGAQFIAMHKNRWWLTPAGATLDAGAYVAGLEYGAEKRALVTGKPSRAFFAEGLRLLAVQFGRGLSPGEVAMVGDDLWNDVKGAQRAGLRGVFVLSGKHGSVELARAAAEPRSWAPDAVAPSIVEVVAALV